MHNEVGMVGDSFILLAESQFLDAFNFKEKPIYQGNAWN